MLHGCQKKILPIVLSLALILNLTLIPGIHSQAATYPATTSFTYNYNGYDYQFYFSGEVDSPQDYRFDSSALDYLINKASEGLNLSISSGLGAKIDWISGIVLNSVFDFYRNFVIATDKVIADWIVWSDIYGFTYTFTGIDTNYPGNETYGDAYGWRFSGWLGEKIDLVLDSQGDLYGSNPIGNYTFSDDQRDFGIWSIHQHDGDDIWIPLNDSSESDDLPMPYFEGNTLHFFARNHGASSHGEYTISNMENTSIVLYRTGSNQGFLSLFSLDSTQNHNWVITYPDNQTYTFSQVGSVNYTNWRSYLDSSVNGTHTLFGHQFFNNYVHMDINLPLFYFQWNNTIYPVTQNNALGFNDNIAISGFADLYLNKLPTSPLPDPIILPVDDPIPVSNIDPDPVVFDPDPGEDPVPVPGIDYPVPDPTPVPVPPLPPLVSGNDDLWPDMNGVFEVESEIDGFLGGLSNFEFTPLRTLVEGFASSLMWVSTIMMALYNGSDFSILFVVLSIFFIAAALLGIYKWWTH